jgi:hypothetical protein
MELNDILTERILVGEFLFGFELEAIYDTTNYGTPELEKKSIEELNIHFSKYFPSTVDKFIQDGSVIGPGFTFEWVSPPLKLNPDNLSKTISLLTSLQKLGVYTNETCGFHIHYSFPDYRQIDGFWIICQLVMEPTLLDRFISFHSIIFSSEKFAKDGFFADIKRELTTLRSGSNPTNSYMTLGSLFNDEKYRVLRLHPQGTIEWRGPRKFLEGNSLGMIKDFFKRVWWIAHTFSSLLSRTEIVGIPKQVFLQRLIDANRDHSYVINSTKRSAYEASKTDFTIFKKNYKNFTQDMITDILLENPEWIKVAPFRTVKNIRELLLADPHQIAQIDSLPETRVVCGDDDIQYMIYKSSAMNATRIPGLIPEIQQEMVEKTPEVVRFIVEPDEDILAEFIVRKPDLYLPNDLQRWIKMYPSLKAIADKHNLYREKPYNGF